MALEAKELGAENIQQSTRLSSHRKSLEAQEIGAENPNLSSHRKSCHRCGNVRKKPRVCQNCPHVSNTCTHLSGYYIIIINVQDAFFNNYLLISLNWYLFISIILHYISLYSEQIFCRSCILKMKTQHGKTTFSSGSCPVCASLCCCSNKSKKCSNKHHCYRKCPVSRESCAKNPNALESKREQLRVEFKFVSENTTVQTQSTDLDSNASIDSETTSDKENNLEPFKYGSLFNNMHPRIQAATSSLQTTSILQRLPSHDEIPPL